MADVIVFGDTMHCPEVRRELPLLVPDPVLYLEVAGARHVVAPAMELPRLRELPGLTCHAFADFGIDQLIRDGAARETALQEVIARAVGELGIAAAVVPYGFPVGLGDRLRGAGIGLTVDDAEFRRRRRVKTGAQLAGMRRAQRAAEHGMDAARRLLRQASRTGRAITVEEVKAVMISAFAERGCTTGDFIVAHGPQSAIGHHTGAGTISPGEPVVIDIAPCDLETACYTDMTRTFCAGQVPQWLAGWLARARPGIPRPRPRAGDRGRAVPAGLRRQLPGPGSPRPSHPAHQPARPGARPRLLPPAGPRRRPCHPRRPDPRAVPGERLITGDVITLEPGLYQPDRGGVRLEDLVLVTPGGAETITDYPYALEP